MSWVMVDVEASGQSPASGDMTQFGAVIVRPPLVATNVFYGVIGNAIARTPSVVERAKVRWEMTDGLYPHVMQDFELWLSRFSVGNPCFISDNNGFDWQFINYYFQYHLGQNPFHHTSTNLGSLYKGLVGDMKKNFKHLRKTLHTHHPVDDAMGNAEALVYMVEEMGLKMELV